MKVILALTLTVLGWSSAFIFIHMGLESFTPAASVYLRYLTAAFVAFAVYLYIPNKRNYSPLDRLKAMGCGAIGMGLYTYAVNLGELTVPASITAFIVGLMPLCSSVAASLFYLEKITKRTYIAIVISFIGLLIIAVSGGKATSFGFGILWLLLAVLCATTYTLLQKNIMKRYTPIEFTCHALWGAAIVSLVFYLFHSPSLLVQIKQANLKSVVAVVMQGIFPSFMSFLGWSYTINRIDINKASLALYTMPLVTAVMSFVFLKEHPSQFALMGMLLSFTGSMVGSIKLPKKLIKT